jgi:hypothetical protein
MFHRTRTTGLENPQDSILSYIATALVPIAATVWKAAQHFSYGARGFMRVPVSEANDLNYLLCRCDEAGYASRLGNNEIQPPKRIGLNSAMKNRAPNNPVKPNLLEQRRAGRWC